MPQGIQSEPFRTSLNTVTSFSNIIGGNFFGCDTEKRFTELERAQLALRLKPIIAEKAKEKQSEGGGAVRQKSDKAVIDTKKELATIAGVSHDTIHKVEVVEKHGTPEIKAKARRGTL